MSKKNKLRHGNIKSNQLRVILGNREDFFLAYRRTEQGLKIGTGHGRYGTFLTRLNS